MSSCLIITQKDKIYIGADTACSAQFDNEFYRVSNNMQKLFKLGNDVFFCAGKSEEVTKCVNWIFKTFKTDINVNELSAYLHDNYSSVINDNHFFDIELLIAKYNEHKIYQISQYNSYQIKEYPYSDYVRVICGGYKTSDVFKQARNYLLAGTPIKMIYKNIFENISDECVGGNLVLYSDTNHMEEIPLIENNIKYTTYANTFLLSSEFVQSGYVAGSQIIGGDIYSENYSSTTGTHIDLNNGTFTFAGGKLKYDGSIMSLDGKITATTGTIGCWTLNSTSIYKGSATFGNSNGMYFGVNGLSLGSNFKVTPNGALVANNVTISGGNIEIGENFSVDQDGVVKAKHLNIFDGTIYLGNNSTAGYICCQEQTTIFETEEEGFFKFIASREISNYCRGYIVKCDCLDLSCYISGNDTCKILYTSEDMLFDGNLYSDCYIKAKGYHGQGYCVTSYEHPCELRWTGSALEVYIDSIKIGNVTLS